MADRTPPSDQELEVLKVLWDEGPSTIRGVNGVLAGRGIKRVYTHVQTLLSRLLIKGHVASEPASDGPAHVFSALSTRDDLLRDRLRDLADQLCEGTPAPLVLTLVEQHRFSDEEVARFRAVLDRHRTNQG